MTGLHTVKIVMVKWRASILSLGCGGWIPVLVGQNAVCQKWQNLDNTIKYNTIQCRIFQATLGDSSVHSWRDIVTVCGHHCGPLCDQGEERAPLQGL